MASLEIPLLTIAIPTFNRAKLLEISLSKIIESVKGYEKHIEVVISDNCSTDDTFLVVERAQRHFPFKYYKNDENIGFNYNYIKLIDEYSFCKYCWVIGDDDFVYSETIGNLIMVLQSENELDCVGMKFDFKTLEEALKVSSTNEKKPGDISKGYFCTFDELINESARPGNLMLTFISSMVFRTDLMKSIDKSRIGKESWDTFYNLFPHSYLYALSLKGLNAYLFTIPTIVAIVHNKEWDSKIKQLYLKFIPSLYEHYLEAGFERAALITQEKLIIKAGVPYLLLGPFSAFRMKFFFLKKYLFNPIFYSSILNLAKRKLSFKLVK